MPEDTQAHDARHDVSLTIAIINAMQDGKTVAELHEEAHPNMIDPAGKFRKENGVATYNFGPYRGLPVREHPEYLEWMLSKSFAPSTMATAQTLLDEIRTENPLNYDYDDIDEEDWEC